MIHKNKSNTLQKLCILKSCFDSILAIGFLDN